MSILIRLVSWLGALGTLLCVVGAVGVWYVEVRIDRVRERLFERVDRSLSEIDGRVAEVQQLAARSKITIEEIQQRAQEFTRREARDRLAEKLDIDARMQRLTGGLQQADLVLDSSQETVRQIRQVLEMGAELGFPLHADVVDPLMDRIGDVQRDLGTAIDTLASLTTQTGEDGDSESVGRRMEQIATIAARLLATFGTVDTRLASFRNRLTDVQVAIGELNSKTHRRVVALAVCATLFLVWMGAGQICLWRWARKT
jgi:chromosome segregation ATPase